MKKTFLFPVGQLSNFVADVMSTGTSYATAEEGKWSKDGAGLTLELEYENYITDRRSLKVSYNNDVDEEVYYGIDGTVFDDDAWNNPYGNTIDDPDEFTNIGFWVYMNSHIYSDFDKFEMSLLGDNTNVTADLNSIVSTTGEWIWFDYAMANISSQDNVDLFQITIDAGTNSGSFLLNNVNIFKRSASNMTTPTYVGSSSNTAATGEYTWKNGLGFSTLNVTPGHNSVQMDCLYTGDDIREVERQLRAMVTHGLVVNEIISRPYPKVYTCSDYENVKTYLLYQETSSPYITSTQDTMYADVVVVRSVRISKKSGEPNVLRFTLDLVKYSG